jgi:hypothetical protein
MTDNIDNALAATIRSMQSVVIPAVDTDHPLAMEQADLIVKTLRMIREQLPDRRGKAFRELDRYIMMAEEVSPMIEWAPAIVDQLDDHLRVARRLRESPSADHLAAHECVVRISACLSTATRDARFVDAATRPALERTVLAASLPIVDDDISWYAPQGWSAPAAH